MVSLKMPSLSEQDLYNTKLTLIFTRIDQLDKAQEIRFKYNTLIFIFLLHKD
jgi:hypothetical protein